MRFPLSTSVLLNVSYGLAGGVRIQGERQHGNMSEACGKGKPIRDAGETGKPLSPLPLCHAVLDGAENRGTGRGTQGQLAGRAEPLAF